MRTKTPAHSIPPAWTSIEARQLHALLADGQESALLDVREEGCFHEGHPLLAVSAPLSHLESRLAALVPRLDTRIVLMDAQGEGLAERAARRMAQWGYANIAILHDGLRGWRQAGLKDYAGIHVPGKAFGAFVERRHATPSIDVLQLKAWIGEGRDMLMLDSRSYEEFHAFSLPGGISCPGAELVHRIFDMVRDHNTTIVINCAGRARAIVGAQSLIHAGLPNPVVTLRNGTAGWCLGGEALAQGSRAVAAPPTPQGLRQAIAASVRVARHFGVHEISIARLRQLQQQAERTLYLFDVRTPEEYESGHMVGARCAPGGQLVQSTDRYVGTRGARIVLCDDSGVRARMTASWLLQMGWGDVFVLHGGLGCCGQPLEKGPEPGIVLPAEQAGDVERLGVAQAQQRIEAGQASVLDLSNSRQYSRGHIPGAWFAIRARLAEAVAQLPLGQMLILTSEDGRFAGQAAADAKLAASGAVAVLHGGNAAWAASGLPLEAGQQRMASAADDMWRNPYEHGDIEARNAALRTYLHWEVNLLGQLDQDETPMLRHFERCASAPDLSSSATT